MEQERKSEKFQPRIVASFSRPQTESVGAWVRRVDLDSKALDHDITFAEAFDRALETGYLDEKGKIMDEKSRKRLRNGLVTINILRKESVRLDQIIGTNQVWQLTQDEDKVEVRWNKIMPSRNFGQRRY